MVYSLRAQELALQLRAGVERNINVHAGEAKSFKPTFKAYLARGGSGYLVYLPDFETALPVATVAEAHNAAREAVAALLRLTDSAVDVTVLGIPVSS